MKVNLSEILNSNEYRNNNYKLPIALGRTEDGQNIIGDLAKMPHLLVAGTTGSGKSVCLDSIIVSLSKLQDVKLLLVDTKVVGFSVYNGMRSLACPVCTDERTVIQKLTILVDEMNKRYELIAANRVRSIEAYNEIAEEKLDRVVLIIDEYADLMMSNKEAERLITILAQKSRACGIHIVLSTQRPSAEVVTGVLKANIPGRIALTVSSSVDSRIILNRSGAELLNGNGDMIYQLGSYEVHLQGAFVSDEEITRFSRENQTTELMVIKKEEVSKVETKSTIDPFLITVATTVINKGFVSIGMIQRYFKVTRGKAIETIDQLERLHVVDVQRGTEARKVLMTMTQFLEVV